MTQLEGGETAPEFDHAITKESVAMIVPMGQSAPVVTEMADYIIKGGAYLKSVWILTTSDPGVKRSYKTAKIALKARYNVKVERIDLPMDDISSTEDNIKFMIFVASVVKKIYSRDKVDKIVLNVAGGRKDMCISLSLIGQLMGINTIMHVIHPEVKIINEKLEQLRAKIDELYRLDDSEAIEYYKKYQNEFDEVMYPPLQDLRFIRIPTMPYPESYVHGLGKLLTAPESGYELNDIDGIGKVDIDRLIAAGLVAEVNVGGGIRKYVPTELGRSLGYIWRQ